MCISERACTSKIYSQIIQKRKITKIKRGNHLNFCLSKIFYYTVLRYCPIISLILKCDNFPYGDMSTLFYVHITDTGQDSTAQQSSTALLLSL